MNSSIAMATYNGEKFILEQLESFANQTVLPNEVVITDDCSTDNTLSLINSFKKTAPFTVRVYSNETNLGYTQNFNKALQLCTNELIFLSDQDDVWFPNKIEYILNLTDQHQDKDLFMIDTELTDGNLHPSGLTKQGQIKNAGQGEKAFVMGSCSAVRKRFLDAILPIPESFIGHDDWIVILADFLHLRIIDKTVLQYYRRHDNNVSNVIYNSLTKINRNIVYKLIKKIVFLFKYSNNTFIEKAIQKHGALLGGIEKLLQHTHYGEKAKKQINKSKKLKKFFYKDL